MNQLRKAKSRNRRRHAVLPRKYIKVVVTYVLLFAIVFSNMSNPLLNVFAGQKKEEFRIHADELQRAAEEALEEGNIVEEPLDFYTKDSSLLKEYEELFAADGTLYEIFPDYEREYYLDDIELRIFLRISLMQIQILRTDRRRNTDLPLYKRRRRNSSRQGKY